MHLVIFDQCNEIEKKENMSLDTSSLEIDKSVKRIKQHLPDDENLNIIENLNIFEEYLKNNKLHNEKIVFIVDMDENGQNVNAYRAIGMMRKFRGALKNSIGGFILLGKTKLYTKSLGQELALAASMSGMYLIGKSLVEKVEDYKNFITLSSVANISKKEAFYKSIENLIDRIINFTLQADESKERKYTLLALHTSHFEKSNTMSLWTMIKKSLSNNIDVLEINLDNGELQDCRGCSHNTCMHFAKQRSCYYGGYMVDEVYPKVLECDALMMICPNYNDSTGANITAFINRLTALYKQYSFEEKLVYSVIISGYSGGDIVAKQLLGAFNMNKGFIIPPNFAVMETANLGGDILNIDNIDKKAEKFACHISESLDFALKKS